MRFFVMFVTAVCVLFLIVYFKTNRREGGGGLPNKLNRYRGGLVNFQASSFNIFISSLVILNELANSASSALSSEHLDMLRRVHSLVECFCS